mmetsp:Transcript_3419/g.7511  ORF Transcript_3419/g.7511 Transcript_3419/m.7511 type:complete len:100 (-) Transcript_3419:126-425(-)
MLHTDMHKSKTGKQMRLMRRITFIGGCGGTYLHLVLLLLLLSFTCAQPPYVRSSNSVDSDNIPSNLQTTNTDNGLNQSNNDERVAKTQSVQLSTRWRIK